MKGLGRQDWKDWEDKIDERLGKQDWWKIGKTRLKGLGKQDWRKTCKQWTVNNNNNGHTIVNTMVTQLFSNCITNADNGMTMYDYWMTIEWQCMTMNDYWMTIEWLLNDYVWPWMTTVCSCMTMYAHEP